MQVVRFSYQGKVGHFLRAEATVCGLTYPVPPLTALLGLVGAVLGLRKDEPQQALEGSRFAVAPYGSLPLRFWQTTNIRKDPPAPLPLRVRAGQQGSSSDQRNTRFAQEWLWKPHYHVWAALPEPYQNQLLRRLKERQWHFTPCLGLAWMLADLDEAVPLEAQSLPSGVHWVNTVAPRDTGEIDLELATQKDLKLQSLLMAATVTPQRVFTQRSYWLEVEARPFPLHTTQAFQCGEHTVVWL